MTRNTSCVAPRPIARGIMSTSASRAAGRRAGRPAAGAARRAARPTAAGRAGGQRRPATTPYGEARDAERRDEQQRARDDPEVVDERRERGRREPAARVEDAGRDRARGEEHRRQDHDPGQLGGLGELRLVEAGGDNGDEPRGEQEHDAGQQHERREHQRRDRRHDPPRPASCSVANSPAMIGMSVDESAPAATSWNRKSGIRNAAKNGPRSPTSGRPRRSRSSARSPGPGTRGTGP